MSEGGPIYSTKEILALTDEEIDEMDGTILRGYLLSILQDEHPSSPELAEISEKLQGRADNL